MSSQELLQNQFLIAMPQLIDINFFRSVVYLCLHTEEGGMGVIVNRPLLDLNLGQVMEQMSIDVTDEKIKQFPVLLGGPVQPDRGFVLHTDDEQSWESTMKTGGTLAITSSQDILKSIAEGKGPSKFLVCLGYSGWGRGEIENEIIHNDWLVSPVCQRILFELPFESRWQSAFEFLGVNRNQLSQDVGHG